MKKVGCLLLAGVLTAGFLSGCGDKKVVDGKTELLIGIPGGDGVTDMRIVDDFIAARSDKYSIKTDVSAWSDFTQKVKLQLVSKNEITPVFYTDSAQAMSFGVQGALENLDGYVKESLDETKYNKALRAVTDTKGNLWGVPHAMNSIAILYNKDIFDEKGVAYPTEDWTWQDMMDMAEKLTFDRDGDGTTDVYGLYYINNITLGWYPFMLAHGTSPLKDDFRNSNLDDPKVLEAMHAFQKPVNEGWVPEPADIAAYGGDAAYFADGKLAMFLAQSSAVKSINKFNPDLNYDAQMMPIGWNGERNLIYVPNVWVICKDASEEVKAAAWDWLTYYLGEESQMKIAETTPSGFPIMKSALDSVSSNGLKPKSKDAFYRGIDEFGTTILENPCSTDVNSVVNNMTLQIRTGGNVEAEVAAAHAELQNTLDYFYETAE